MVVKNNSWIVVDKSEKSYFPLTLNLRYIQKASKRSIRKNKRVLQIDIPEKVIKLYKEHNDKIYIPIGLESFVEDYIKDSLIDDKRSLSNLSNVTDVILDINSYENILPGITLRRNQLIAVRKMLYTKRCIIQAGTGTGKTEMLCAFIKILTSINGGVTPTTVLMEPTMKLMNDIYKRFKNYGIDIVKYSENRRIIENHVNICQPISLGNDIDKDESILDSVEVLLGDETHHFSCPSFQKPTFYMKNLVYCIGVSASAIGHEVVNSTNISDFNLQELMTMSAIGRCVMDILPKSSINSKDLASPILVTLNNKADEKIPYDDPSNWHEVVKNRLESENRLNLCVGAAVFFNNHGRKSLILTNTIRSARSLLKIFYENGMGDLVRASYGGGSFEYYNGYEYVSSEDDVFERYNSGYYTVIIGTGHLVEGVDVPNLDAVILQYSGKSDRILVQSIGRVLRKSKTGKYAWIIDFNDYECPTLSRHYNKRFDKYLNVIGVPSNQIYDGFDLNQLEDIFKSQEEL